MLLQATHIWWTNMLSTSLPSTSWRGTCSPAARTHTRKAPPASALPSCSWQGACSPAAHALTPVCAVRAALCCHWTRVCAAAYRCCRASRLAAAGPAAAAAREVATGVVVFPSSSAVQVWSGCRRWPARARQARLVLQAKRKRGPACTCTCRHAWVCKQARALETKSA